MGMIRDSLRSSTRISRFHTPTNSLRERRHIAHALHRDIDLEQNYWQVVNRCHRYRIYINPPSVYRANFKYLDPTHDSEFLSNRAFLYVPKNPRPLCRDAILANSLSLPRLRENEEVLKAMLAHELGHAVQGRFRHHTEHPFISAMQFIHDKELFADAFVAYLYGSAVVLKIKQALGDTRVPYYQILRLNIDTIPRYF